MLSARRVFALLQVLFCAVAFAGAGTHDLPKPEAGKLTVYYFDVGQGDSALIVSPTGKTVLVDGGPPDSAESLAEKVRSIVSGPLDLVVLSHPHLDHLGGMGEVIKAVGAKRYLDPGFDQPSSHYKELLNLVADKQIPYVEPKPGEGGAPFGMGMGGGAQITVLWPRAPVEPFFSNTRSDANANSVVFRLAYGKTAFYFSGDSEAETEAKVLASGVKLTATVYKVAHHGSRYSNGDEMLAALAPKVAVISCGAHNDYHHPNPQALERLGKTDAKVVRTDLSGDVVAVSDGAFVTVETISPDGAVTKVGRFEGVSPPVPMAAAEHDDSATQETAAQDGAGSPEDERAVHHRSRSKHSDANATTDEVQPASSQGSGTTVAATGMTYAASRKSKVFHRADCRAVSRISPKNLETFADRASAMKDHTPAGDCNP